MPNWQELTAALNAAPDASPLQEAAIPSDAPRAAVAAIFAPDSQGRACVLLMQRAHRPGDPWGGHIGLPGGRAELVDDDTVATALRETEEEVGLVIPRSALIGGIAPRQARRRDVAVHLWVDLFAFAIDQQQAPGTSDEVDEARWISVAALTDPGNADSKTIETAHATHQYPAIALDDWRLWGLTWWMLKDLLAPVGHDLVGHHQP